MRQESCHSLKFQVRGSVSRPIRSPASQGSLILPANEKPGQGRPTEGLTTRSTHLAPPPAAGRKRSASTAMLLTASRSPKAPVPYRFQPSQGTRIRRRRPIFQPRIGRASASWAVAAVVIRNPERLPSCSIRQRRSIFHPRIGRSGGLSWIVSLRQRRSIFQPRIGRASGLSWVPIASAIGNPERVAAAPTAAHCRPMPPPLSGASRYWNDHYANGVLSFSPGLVAPATYPGSNRQRHRQP
jgi:hypothetical protein